MKEITTNELLQYKAGFIEGKNDIIELTRLGKLIDFDENKVVMTWHDFGYKDAIEFYSNAISENIDIAIIRVKDVVKELFSKRVIKYNLENKKETPISKFRF